VRWLGKRVLAIPPLWWACFAGLVIGAPSVARAAGETNPVILGATAAAAALAGIAASGIQQAYGAARAVRYADALNFKRGCLADRHGRAPLVRDITDPTILGVHRALTIPAQTAAVDSVPRLDSPGRRELPAYVERDIDASLRRRMAAGGFVMLVGDSAAGKTRAAFEAVAATLPDHVLLVPGSLDALPAAMAEAARSGKWVLWLDDIERFTGTGGLSGVALAQLLALPGHHAVVATLRAAEHARLMATASGPAVDTGVRSGREARDVLDLADILWLPRLFSYSEQLRARACEWDRRIAEAITHAGEYGVAEYLAAGPQLVDAWLSGWAPGVHPRGAALIAAAVDCRRAGLTGPLARELLQEIHENYLAARGGPLLRPESLADGWNWATAPWADTTIAALYAGPSSAGSVKDVLVFDYVVDHVQRHPSAETRIPVATLTAAVRYATVTEAATIGATCRDQGWDHVVGDIYEHAIRLAEATVGPDHPDTLLMRAKLADVRFDEGYHQEAEAEYRTLIRALSRTVGPDHDDTLRISSYLGTVLNLDGRPQEAEAQYRAVLDRRMQLGQDDDPETLRVRELTAFAWSAQGRIEEAEAELRLVVEALRSVLGPDHPRTLRATISLANVMSGLGKYAQAEREFQAVAQGYARVRGSEDLETLRVRESIARIWELQGRQQEAETELQAIADATIRVLGPDHPAAAAARARLADRPRTPKQLGPFT
jgi:hypothetical protein